jgi:hypothetical protein
MIVRFHYSRSIVVILFLQAVKFSVNQLLPLTLVHSTYESLQHYQISISLLPALLFVIRIMNFIMQLVHG